MRIYSIFGMLIAMLLFIVLTTTIMDAVDNERPVSNLTSSSVETLVELMPLIYVMIPVMLIVSILGYSPSREYIKEKISNRSPEDILKERYAKGEIDSLEFLERMTRL